jgi:hypothetical protein
MPCPPGEKRMFSIRGKYFLPVLPQASPVENPIKTALAGPDPPAQVKKHDPRLKSPGFLF